MPTPPNATAKHGIYVKAWGEYYAKTISNCLEKPFEIEIQLTDNPDAPIPNAKRLHQVVKNQLAPHYFQNHRDEYPDYKGVRLCKILDAEVFRNAKLAKSGKKDSNDISQMNMNELVNFSAINELLVDVRDYATIAAARLAVADALENRKLAEAETFNIKQAAHQKKARAFDDVQEFMDFNKVRV